MVARVARPSRFETERICENERILPSGSYIKRHAWRRVPAMRSGSSTGFPWCVKPKKRRYGTVYSVRLGMPIGCMRMSAARHGHVAAVLDRGSADRVGPEQGLGQKARAAEMRGKPCAGSRPDRTPVDIGTRRRAEHRPLWQVCRTRRWMTAVQKGRSTNAGASPCPRHVPCGQFPRPHQFPWNRPGPLRERRLLQTGRSDPLLMKFRRADSGLGPSLHPAMGRVPVTFEPKWLGEATGRGAEPPV